MTDRSDQLKPSDRPSDRIKMTPTTVPTDRSQIPTTGADYVHRQHAPSGEAQSVGRTINNRLGSMGVAKLRTKISDRDLLIISFVREHKFVTTRQLQRLYFIDHATSEAATRACTRVLTRLRQHRFLFRLQRPIGGIRGGSSAFVWGLDVAGDRITRSTSDAARIRQTEPTTAFLSHTLAVTEVRVQLEEAGAARRFELVEAVTEPSNWRPFTRRSGPTILKPDLYAVTANAEYEDFWFIEVDLGTESVHGALLNKCRRYFDHSLTGAEQRESGVYPLVAWLMTTVERVDQLRRAIDQDRHLPSALFQVYLAGDFVRSIVDTALALPPLS